MPQGKRSDRVGEEIREEITDLLVREVHDPGIGFVTVTRVSMSPDLQLARIYYTLIGDDRAKRDTARALERAAPFLRRHIASRIRLRRVPELRFYFDEGVEHQERIERILLDLEEERKARQPETPADAPASGTSDPGPTDNEPGGSR